MLKKIKRKKCGKCKWNFKFGDINCCNIPNNALYTLKPLRLICFKYKKRRNNYA